MQICSKLLIEKMFYYKFFCQTIQCPKKEGGRIPPPSDVLPTEKHADVTRVKSTIHDPKSNQNYVSKKFLLHLLFDNLISFFSKTAYGCFYFNSYRAQFP